MAAKFAKIVGYDPVENMLKNAYQKDNIRYTPNYNDLLEQKFDVIWITKYLPSFLNRDERAKLYGDLKTILKTKGYILIKPDIMSLNYTSSLRFKFASDFLRFFKTNIFFEKGDTLRVNLDLHIGDEKFVFYHYFDSQIDFILEVEDNGFSAQIYSLGFFKLYPKTQS